MAVLRFTAGLLWMALPRSIIARSTPTAVAVWTLQMALGIVYVMAGVSKLVGYPAAIALFHAVGAGEWLRYVVGSIETAAALLLLFAPTLGGIAALALCPVMIGAVATTFILPHHSRAAAIICLLGVIVVAWLRRADTGRALHRTAMALGVHRRLS